MLTRRRILRTSLLAAPAGVMRPPACLAAGIATRLRVGTYRGFDDTLLPGTGQDRTPYRLEYHEFSAGNLITQAIDAGALDLGSWSEIPLVFAAASGARLRVVAVMEGPASDQAVLVPRGSTARSIADLRGKRVGYVRATTAHYFLLRMLAQHGMGFDDIQPIALSVPAGLTAMTSGALDAWATYGYAIAILQDRTGAQVLQNAVGILSGNYLIGVASDRLADPAFRAAAADYIGRVNTTYTILEADKPRWARLVSPVISLPERLILADLRAQDRPFHLRAIRPSDIASAQLVAEMFERARLLPPGVQVASSFSDALAPLLARS